MLILGSGIAFFGMFAASWFGYRDYRKDTTAWKRYLVLYLFCMAFFEGIAFFVFFSAPFPVCCRGIFLIVLELIRFSLAGIILYAYPVCLLHAIRRNPSSKMKLVLLIISAWVLIFGVIVLIWKLDRLAAALRYFFYFYMLVFTGVGIARWKALWRIRLKRGLLIFLCISFVYFIWAVLDGVLTGPVTIFGHILYTLLGGFLLSGFYLALFRKKGKYKNHTRQELFENAGIGAREAEIISLIEEGFTNKQIGNKINVDVKTVDEYIFTIYKKLNVNNRLELFKKLSGD